MPTSSTPTNAASLTKQSILFLAQLPPPTHGVTTVSKRVFDLITADDAPFAAVHIWGGSAKKITDIGKRSLAKYTGFAGMLARVAARRFTHGKADVAYITLAPHGEAVPRDMMVIAAAKKAAHRVLVHIHTRGLSDLVTTDANAARYRAILTGTEAITLSQTLAVSAEKLGIFTTAHHLDNCCADPGTNTKRTNADSARPLRLGYFGSMDPRKGVLRFILVCQALAARGIAFDADIAGAETAFLSIKDAERFITDHGSQDRIRVHGFLRSEDAKADFLAPLDIMLYPTQHDLAPLVLLEAFSHGVVPISYDTGAIAGMMGDAFAANVISSALPQADAIEQLTQAIASYDANRAMLAGDQVRAREKYLAQHTPRTYADTLFEILTTARTTANTPPRFTAAA